MRCTLYGFITDYVKDIFIEDILFHILEKLKEVTEGKTHCTKGKKKKKKKKPQNRVWRLEMLQWWKKSLSPSVTRVRFSEQALRGLRFFVFHKCEMRTNNHSKNAVVRLSLKVESGSFRCCAFLIQFIRIQTYAMFKLASWLNVILKRLQKALTCCCWLLKFFVCFLCR